MQNILKRLWRYIVSRLDSITAWVGFIGLALQMLGLQSFMFFLFILLIVLPEKHFRETFAGWTKGVKELGNDD